MTDNELKRSLIARINQIKDPAFLKALLVIAESQAAAINKPYNWNETPRRWMERNAPQEYGDSAGGENFFEDMEQLLRENN